MRIYALKCSTCGAPIEVSARRRLAKCPYCESHLVIVRDDEGAHAETQGKPDDPIWLKRDDERAIELRRRIRDLDEQWITDRMRFIRTRADGRYFIDTAIAEIYTWAFVLVAGLLTPLVTWAMKLPWLIALVGALPLGYVLWAMEEDRTSGRDYRSLRSEYEQQRNDLFNELTSLS